MNSFVLQRLPRKAALAALAGSAVLLTACGGGASDSAASPDRSSGASAETLSLFAYSVVKPGFDAVAPAFAQTAAGKGITVQGSYGPSGDQSRKVASGAPADVVNFSVEPDVTRLVSAGLVDADWNSNADKGIPFGSVVSIVVRKGNPKHIHSWDDLLAPGVQVVTPNPFSSGSAKWNLLAPYAARSEGGKNPQAGLDYIHALVGDHVKVQPKSGREASETFLQGTGDVLLSYEDEALALERSGAAVEHIVPEQTFKIENPVAVVKTSKHLDKATAFRDYLFTPDAQRLWAKAGFRPVDGSVAKEFASEFPAPKKLWTIADLGGWARVDKQLFTPNTGSIAVIYDTATK
ncbi:sulfate ABC transporter substrate-binding protein [Skermania sp. ID1734]|uniref:sulfate ABC transporter substrate-binding protein n=1 Tax=Skermania sp. ID1734 TaxID=2597516 RepID=UPI00117FEE7B|nr:sulfate ABC transporter substrate-binding protein [Skermania sp. ID1734]TSD99503.1 sulfate ABC transporter substrate-binding protein [Skermania sp. ID1734]